MRSALQHGLTSAFVSLMLVSMPLAAGEVSAAAAVAPIEPVRDLDSVVVSGVLPGPGMWKVSKGEHAMWVLGTQSPLPKKMEWRAREVEAVLAEAEEVLQSGGVSVGSEGLGFFGKLALLPSLIGVRKNPDGAELKGLVSPDEYAKWQELKQRYIGRDNGIESWRPLFAAMRLYEEAIEDAGLANSGVVWPVIEAAIKQRKLKITMPMLKVEVPNPKAALREFKAERLADLDCFSKTLRQLEPDLVTMRSRANAWAVGDIAALRGLPLGDQKQVCMDAALSSGVVRKYGPADVKAAMRAKWLEAAEQALQRNRVTFALLPMSELLRDDGYLSVLRQRGYQVIAPDEDDATAPGLEAAGVADAAG